MGFTQVKKLNTVFKSKVPKTKPVQTHSFYIMLESEDCLQKKSLCKTHVIKGQKVEDCLQQIIMYI
jgi:hypothetical protein